MLDEFPVDERDVPRVAISAQKLEEWRGVGWTEVSRALTQRSSWYFQFQDKTREGYEQIANKDNLVAYARGVPNSPHKNVLIRASLDTTLDAIVYGLYCETTREQRCAFAHLYDDHFLDGAVLHVGKTRTREDPFRFVGMKWVAFRSPAPALVTSRDFIYFSYSGTTRDADGQRVLFRLLRSMPMDGVHVQERTNNSNLVRGKISYLYLYRENGARTEVSIQALHSTAGSLPSWAVTKTISFVWPGIFNLVTVAEAKILMLNGMASTQNAFMVSSSSSSSSSSSAKSANQSSCGVCFRRFRMMRSKRACRGCHELMCKTCTVKLSFLDERKERSDTGVLALRFCLNCMVKARTERQQVTAHTLGLRDDSSAAATDIDVDDFNALDVSIYRETLKTKYLDVLSDDEGDRDGDKEDDMDDLNDDDDESVPILEQQQLFPTSRIKAKYEPSYSNGESFEGTSVMSSNPSLASSSNPSFASNASSLGAFSLSASSLSSSQGNLSRHNSGTDLLFYSSRGPTRSGRNKSSSSQFSASGFQKTTSAAAAASAAPAEPSQEQVNDLEQTFRLRMVLFPDEAKEERRDVTQSQRSTPPARMY